jgi:hypothetical protein
MFSMSFIIYLSDLETSSLEITEISDVKFGEKVKIYGIINSTERIAIKGTYEGDSSRWLWLPNNFNVDDDSGTIWADTSYFWAARTNRIKYGSHEDRQYWDGDEICMIGTIYNNTVKGKMITPDYIGQNPDDFRGFPISVVFLFGIFTAFLVLISFLMGNNLQERGRLHIQNFEDFSPKNILKKKIDRKKSHWKTHKVGWTAFNYAMALKTTFAMLIIFFGVIVFIFVLIFSASQTTADNVDWGGICLLSSLITIFLSGFTFALLGYGLSLQVGEFTLKYEGDKYKYRFYDIEKKLIAVFDDFGFQYTKKKKQIYQGSWRVDLNIPRECGNIMFTYTERMDRFDLLIKIGRGVKEDNEYKEQIRGTIEVVLDEYLKLETD